MTTSAERTVNIEAVRTPNVRNAPGILAALGASIAEEGMRHPLTLWKDGTLISGSRRHRASLLLNRQHVPAVFVDTIEDAAKQLLVDNEDDHLALPMKWSEVCRLWGLLRRFDEPAAVKRIDAARRAGALLRQQTRAGLRRPGRSSAHTEDYVLSVLAPPFGTSEATAKRLWAIYSLAYGLTDDIDRAKRDHAQRAMANIDSGESSIYGSYSALLAGRTPPAAPRTKAVEPVEAVAARAQQTAWARSLPQLEGLVAGLVELGSPNADLTWEQVAPVHARLSAVRRDLEKMIKKMKEINQS